MKILLITGSYPPDICGIGDYCFQLAKCLDEEGITTDIFTGKKWGLQNLNNLASEITEKNPDIIHIQYPTFGYGIGLAPQALTILKKAIVTIHEISQAHILRRLSLYPFYIFAENIIFTSQFEKEYACKWAPWIDKTSSIIPIGSNISSNAYLGERERKRIVYFGLIGPNKGIEDVIELGRIIDGEQLDLEICIIGLPNPKYPWYLEKLKTENRELPISWKVGLSDAEVSAILSKSKIGYLPFPDGVSERRGSFLALLSNGVVPVTRQGLHTTHSLKEVACFCDSPRNALSCIQHLLEDGMEWERLSQNGRKYSERFLWSSIAKKHVHLYEKILKKRENIG